MNCPPHDYQPMGGGGSVCNKCDKIIFAPNLGIVQSLI